MVADYGSYGSEMRPLNLETKTFGEPYPIPANAWSLLSGDENYDFYYTSGMYLYGFHLGDESAEEVLNWMSCDINGQALDTFPPGRYVLETQNMPLLRRILNRDKERYKVPRKVQDVIDLLSGIDCKGRGTSCPDQLARALKKL